MCKEASFIVTKNKDFGSEQSDRHEDIIKEFGLHSDGVNGPNLVRVEITPPDDNFAAPPEQWMLRVDQDLLPDWWNATEAEARLRAGALKEWIAYHVHTEGHVELRHGKHHLYDSAKAMLYGSVQAMLYGSVQAMLYDSAQATLYGSAQATLYDSAKPRCTDHKLLLFCTKSREHVLSSDEEITVRSSLELANSFPPPCSNYPTMYSIVGTKPNRKGSTDERSNKTDESGGKEPRARAGNWFLSRSH